MSNDRELLEMAAKAAGLSTRHKWNAERLLLDPPVLSLVVFRDGELSSTGWNPISNGGDALRLAVACGIAVTPYPIYEWPKHSVVAARRSIESSSAEVIELYGNDPDAATRRAIVRAAAEIGKSMP